MSNTKRHTFPLFCAIMFVAIVVSSASAQSWRSDARSIAFDAILDRDRELYVIDTKSGQLKHYSFNRAEDFRPVWSPDGRSLLFFRGQGKDTKLPIREQEFDIYMIDVKTKRETRLTTFHGYEGDPAWSPSGQQLVFTSNHLSRDENFDIFVKSIRGRGVTRLTDNKAPDGSPKFSPDGKTIIFVSRRDGYDQIYRMNADGSNQRRLLKSGSAESQPGYSPNGKKIVFMSQRHVKSKKGDKPTSNSQEMEIYIANADGTGAKRLTYRKGMEVSPVFSPDGKSVAFSYQGDDGKVESMFVMDIDGSKMTRVIIPTPTQKKAVPARVIRAPTQGPRGFKTK
jgi:Tol biopolymer transport system component